MMTSPLRPLVLCADDYGLAPGVSRGICELIGEGRLSATSCMTPSRFWPEHAGWLVPHRGRIDVGLHLTLTHLPPLGPMPRTAPDGRLPGLGAVIARALSRRLDPGEIAAELTRQLDAFESAVGGPPDFLDGHQHVHQLPVVREVVFDLYRRRLAGSGAYLRVCAEPLATVFARRVDPLRAAVISLLGRGFASRVRQAGIASNDSFRGVHDFSGCTDYAALFERFLQGAGERPLIMCHPGHSDADLARVDAVTVQRERELRFLRSEAFATALRRCNFRLARFAETMAAGTAASSA